MLDSYVKSLHDFAPIATIRLSNRPPFSSLTRSDMFLVSVILLISSRYHTLPGFSGRARCDWIHTRMWDFVMLRINRVFWSPLMKTLGTIEALLLLSEWAPKIVCGELSCRLNADTVLATQIHHISEEEPRQSDHTSIPLLAPARVFDELSDMFIGTVSVSIDF